MRHATSRIGRVARATATTCALTLCAGAAYADLVALYTFDGNASDVSGNGRDASFVSATVATGYQGQAYQFNGTSDYIRVPVDINPATLPQLTMGAWVLLDRPSASANYSGAQTFISHDNGSFDRTLDQDPRAGGNDFSAFTGSGGVLGGSPIVTAQWVFIAARYDQVARTAVLNVDGSQYAQANVQQGAGWSYTDIGNNPSFATYLQGRVDNVFFFDTVLSDAQIETIRLGGAAAILTAVPEPGVWVLLVSGLAFVASRRRNRAES